MTSHNIKKGSYLVADKNLFNILIDVDKFSMAVNWQTKSLKTPINNKLCEYITINMVMHINKPTYLKYTSEIGDFTLEIFKEQKLVNRFELKNIEHYVAIPVVGFRTFSAILHNYDIYLGNCHADILNTNAFINNSDVYGNVYTGLNITINQLTREIYYKDCTCQPEFHILAVDKEVNLDIVHTKLHSLGYSVHIDELINTNVTEFKKIKLTLDKFN